MRRSSGRFSITSLCALACVVAAVVSFWPAGILLRTEDRNRDGRADVWRAYDRRGRITSIDVDTNFDGRADVQEYYERGALVRRESDRDFDDQVDLVQVFDAETRESVRLISDVDFDGSADLLVLFSDGQPAASRWRSGFPSGLPAASGARPSPAVPRTAADRLGTFHDPFDGDTVIRAVPVTPPPGGEVGTTPSGGLPRSADTIVGPARSASRQPDLETSHPPSRVPVARSPRGPPLAA